MPGTAPGGEEQEWELFDCDKDSMELFNVWSDEEYTHIANRMLRALEWKMAEIGDVAVHPIGIDVDELRTRYPPSGMAERASASQHNM